MLTSSKYFPRILKVSYHLLAAMLLTNCTQGSTTEFPLSTGTTNSTSPSTTSSSGPSARPKPPSPPMDVGATNARGQEPAFSQQTRAPGMASPPPVSTVISNELNSPWGMTFLPDGRILITEISGTLLLLTQDGNKSTITGLPTVYYRGQGGLLDVTIDPDFTNNRLIYISYAEDRSNSENGTTVARGRLSADGKILEQVEIIFRQLPSWNSYYHYGSRLIFDHDGFLYITLGERSLPSARAQSQDPNSHLGKVIRIHGDGSVPTSNPFFNGGGAQEVWSYGHRNIQGAAIHPTTGALWTMEHGPRGGDELNIPQAGRNYGWPIITYGIDYSGAPIGEGITQQEGMEQPVYYFDPVIAPADIVFYTGSLFKDWNGDLLLTALNSTGRNQALGSLVRLRLDGQKVIGEQRYLSDIARIRDVEVGPDGSIWIITNEGSSSRLIKLTPL